MDSDFLSYIQRLELIGFFAGYPLVYTVLFYLSVQKNRSQFFFAKIFSLLPYTYAIAGILYTGLQLKNIYPDYSIENIEHTVQAPFLAVWAILSVAFLIPAIANKSYISLLHSLIFFLLLVMDIVTGSAASSTDGSLLHNAMNIYTASLLFYITALVVLFLISTSGYLKDSFRK